MTRFGVPFGRGEKMKANRAAALDFHTYLAQKDVTAWHTKSTHRFGQDRIDIGFLLTTQIEGKLFEVQYSALYAPAGEAATIFTALEWDVARHHHKLLIGVIVWDGATSIGWRRRVSPKALMQGLHHTLSDEITHWMQLRALMIEP